MVGGYVLVSASIGSESPEPATIGGLAALSGFIVQIISHKHIGRAGEIPERGNLTTLNMTGSHAGLGPGLAYRF